MTCTNCEKACNQGRLCSGSTNASRAALGMRPLGGGGYHPALVEPRATVLADIIAACRVAVSEFRRARSRRRARASIRSPF